MNEHMKDDIRGLIDRIIDNCRDSQAALDTLEARYGVKGTVGVDNFTVYSVDGKNYNNCFGGADFQFYRGQDLIADALGAERQINRGRYRGDCRMYIVYRDCLFTQLSNNGRFRKAKRRNNKYTRG